MKGVALCSFLFPLAVPLSFAPGRSGLQPVAELLGRRALLAGQGNTRPSARYYFRIVFCHPLIHALFTTHVEASLQTHHDERLGDPEIGWVAHFTLQLADCLLIQQAKTRSSVLQMEFTLQKLPERLQLADDIRCFISRSGDLAREKIEQDFTQMMRRHLRGDDAEIVYSKINQHTRPACFNAFVPERLAFGRLLKQLK